MFGDIFFVVKLISDEECPRASVGEPGLHTTGRLHELYDDLDVVAADHPMGRIGEPADFGRIVAFLCSETANYINGTGLPVEGGSLKVS